MTYDLEVKQRSYFASMKEEKEDSVTSVKAAEGGGQCWNQAQNENLTIILETLKQFKWPLISNNTAELTIIYPRKNRRPAKGLCTMKSEKLRGGEEMRIDCYDQEGAEKEKRNSQKDSKENRKV